MGGGGGLKTSQPKARGSGGGASSARRFWQFFNKNNAFLCIFRPKQSLKSNNNSSIKTFEKQSKRVVDRINEVQVL